MFVDNDLLTVVSNESSIDIATLLLAEFNLNDLDNISKIGNYFHRPGTASVATNSYDPDDIAGSYTDSDISYEEYKITDDDPYRVEDKSPKYFYSLGDCFLPFRPRSGINKVRYRSGHFIDNVRSAERPRYFIPNRHDYFKYWSSYKKEGVYERGISGLFNSASGFYPMTDAAPFVVYNDPVPANRIVIKMQTNVGTLDLGTARNANDEYINDPLFDYANATVPRNWRVQKLDGSSWVDIKSFTSSSERTNGDPIVPKDGNAELFYGITVPDGFEDTFEFLGYVHESLIPETGNIGDAFIYGSSDMAIGTLVVWDGAWTEYDLSYSWQLLEGVHLKSNGNAKTLVDPLQFAGTYREIDYLSGLRIVVDTMNAPEACFDLIELSPRLSADVSDYALELSITKNLVGSNNGIPVGNILATNGQLTLTNVDNAFTSSSTSSIVAPWMNQTIKFIPYQVFYGIAGSNKYVPIKTMYSDKFVTPVDANDDLTIPLRDLYFRLETTNSPSVLYKDTRLTYAVSCLLDYIGFSNYVFKTVNNEDPILPYFFVEKNVSVAEILNRLAQATQSAMFFDEYNNLVVMTKEYLLPDDRETDFVLSGNDTPLANIESIRSGDVTIFNDGNVGYTIRYIQREVSTIGSTINLDSERTYRYKPVLLWEVAANEETKTVNEATKNASGFALGAAALNTTLDAVHPMVSGGSVINNVIDLGESVYWLPRFKGYLYANGEIIRFDAVEYAVPGNSPVNVWIGTNSEYQRYFASLPFNGKIYPTGRVRIYSEPFYADDTTLQEGAVKVSGRAQFDTEITSHAAGLGNFWSNDSNAFGLRMYSENLFSTVPTEDLPVPSLSGTTRVEQSNINTLGRKSTRNGIIKNFMASNVFEDGYVNRLTATTSGTIQASALVMRGPRPDAAVPNHRDMVSYVYKDLSAGAFQHFGTRMRIIGKTDQNFGQIANGSSNYYSIQAIDVEDCTSVNGGSGGIGIFTDPSNGSGYYLELVALSDSNIDKYAQMTDAVGNEAVVHNIVFYKVNAKTKSGDGSDKPAVPQKLWGGLTNVIVDAGLFTGQDRLAVGENNSVYDLAIEYEVLPGGAINFYLFINNILVKIVKDRNPLPVRTTTALFVRASSEIMFENIYAIEDIVARGQSSTLADMNGTFDSNGMSTNEFLKKYAVSGMVQSSFLSNISSTNPLHAKLYFDEFGTIMREAVHFSVNYDQAFPAFYSKVAPTFTADRAFVVSKYYGGAYDAEFLVFNSADKAIVLDETTGSYLRILGITFTQNSSTNLTVDDYYGRISDLSNPESGVSPKAALRDYNKIKASRAKYGTREFSLDSMYIQSRDQAEELMGWLINKTLRPRHTFTITTFPMAFLQVGDLVTIEYSNGEEYVDPTKQFVIGQIQYSIREGEVTQTLVVYEV